MDFTCELRQNSAAVAATTTSATFTIRGGWCTAQIRLAATAAGTVGTAVTVAVTGLPAERQTTYTNYCRGWARCTDIGTASYVVPARFSSGVITPQDLGVSPSFAIASGDLVSIYLKYPVA